MIMLIIRTENVTENIILLKFSVKIAIQSSPLNRERVEDGHFQMKTCRCKTSQNPGKKSL